MIGHNWSGRQFYFYTPMIFVGISFGLLCFWFLVGIGLSGNSTVPILYQAVISVVFFPILPFISFLDSSNVSLGNIVLINFFGWAVFGLIVGTFLHVFRELTRRRKAFAVGTPRSIVLSEIGQPQASEVRGEKHVDVFTFPLAFSALYEIIEWLASLLNPTDTEAFLGTQGYIWDTQTDMFWCLIGSIITLIFLTRFHNKYLLKI
jgi:hypothetical protein